MGKQSSGGTQTTRMEPPDYIKPYLQQAAQSAFGLYAGPGANIQPQAGSQSGLANAAGGLLGRISSQRGGQTPSLPNIDPFSAWTPEYFPGSTVAQFSGATNAALSGITERAMNGSPLVDQAQSFVQQGLAAPVQSAFGAQTNPYASPVGVQQVSGGAAENPYASVANPFGGASNPYLDATYDKAFGKAMQSVESQFARGGRNIGASQPVAGDIASSLASQIYAPAYENERNRQQAFAQQQLGIGAQGFESGQSRALQAGMANQGAGLQAQLAGQQIGAQGFENAQNRQLSDLTAQRQMQQGLLGYASPLAAQDYLDLAQLQGAGQMYDTQNQALLNDQINRWNYNQNAPGMALDSLIQRLNGMPGSTQVTQLPDQSRNAGAGAIGGAMAGYQMFGPWGALGGGILGAL
jgi:hypothetical protein